MDFQITTKVPVKRVSDMLVSALEGGSNYWYMIQEKIEPQNFDNLKDEISPDKPFAYTLPFNPGGALLIDDSMAKGLQTMAEKYPRHYANFISENDDAETGDVFLQCCILGEVVYG